MSMPSILSMGTVRLPLSRKLALSIRCNCSDSATAVAPVVVSYKVLVKKASRKLGASVHPAAVSADCGPTGT